MGADPRRGGRTPARGRACHGSGRSGRHGDDGQIGVFLLGACVVGLTMVVGVVDVTAVQLARIGLYDACDAAALDAADEISEESVYHQGLGERLPVTQEGVRRRAAAYLDRARRPDHVTAWTLGPGTGTGDGVSATVEVVATVEPPIGAALLGAVTGPVTIRVDATAAGLVGR